MTESVDTKVEDKVVETSVTPQLTELEQSAVADGWTPKEEWIAAGKSEDDWRPAKEFKDRGELFKTIHSLKRENKQTQAALDALAKHHQYVFDMAHQKALTDLKKERRQALKDEDVDRVEAIETKIQETETQHQQAKAALQPVVQTPAIVPEFQVWKDKNSWYDTDEELRQYADVEGLVYLQRNPEMRNDPAGALRAVEERVKKRFPEKFGVRKAAPSAVAAVDKTAKKSSKDSDIELSETEKEMMNTFVRQGVMTREQYIADLKKVR